IPIPTFGLFMLLSFVAAWWIFRLEYKRKEADGIIHSLPAPTPIPGINHIALFLTTFIIGAKAIYWWTNRSYYIGPLPDFLFSFRGNLTGGFTISLITLLTTWLYQRRQAPKTTARPIPAPLPAPAPHLIHPCQLMDRLLFFCGLAGFAGAILFAKLEGVSGLNYYGALIAGAITYLYINRKHGIPLSIAADIGSPGMMLAYAIGRFGCHLAGDGDWGVTNNMPQPPWLQWAPAWTWSLRYPHNSIHQGIFIPGCTGNYCTQLPYPVYPTSFYEAVICLLLFATLWTLRTRLSRPGLLFSIFALLNGIERLTIEFIRINPKYAIGPWTLSQAQILALGWIITGLITLFILIAKIPATISNHTNS
ncbi:MAG TPA: prolipoprotein diacylglyceryl transferase family protein, partial [Puia sp.]